MTAPKARQIVLAARPQGKPRPMVETAPLEQAADAYGRMMEGKARFHIVLVTGQ
jgi:D-arabinose 1-dehydrogenase-like Zn-dependent alcohol dehydrogenase